MRSAYCRWLLIGLLAASSGVATTGCGNDQETINRVQPNALEKSDFEGEFYMLGTIIDTQVDAPVAVGFPTGFDRVKWEIQEDYLIAKRTYQAVRNVETNSLIEENETASIVAVFAIDSHFDVRRDYNPATGEQTNVVVENTTDRPWYQREFMRVDWSQNLLDEGMLPGGVSMKPIALFDQRTSQLKDSELDPHFERTEGGALKYFDLVNKFWAQPALTSIDQDGDGVAETQIPACNLIMNMQMDCSPAAVAIRYSFARVEDRDYQPMEYTPDRMDRFGYFLTKRDSFDEHYGITVAGRRVFANRHNIWLESHLRNDAGELAACKLESGKADPCGGKVAGSVCDVAFARAYGQSEGACTIPYRERAVRPIVYYVTPNMPKTFMPDALEVGDQWNVAFTQTVASLRRLECEEAGGNDCGKYTPEKTERVFYVCNNPVAADDPEACGPKDFSPRYGDVRYSFISWVSEAHSAFSGAPLGLGPSFADPFTGEILSGVGNMYGAGIDNYATFGRDVLAMMHGDMNLSDPQSNAAFAAWIAKAQKDQDAAVSEREADRHVVKLDAYDMVEANEDMNFEWAMARLPKYGQPATPEFIKQMAPKHWKAIDGMHEQLAFARKGAGKLRQLRGTYIEDMMLNDEYSITAGLLPGETLPAHERARLSPFSPGGAFNARGELRARKAKLRNQGTDSLCFITASDFDDEGMVGLLNEIEDAVTNGDGSVTWYGQTYQVGTNGQINYELVKEMLKHPMFFGLTAHEVGHSIGLMHNFSGSYDALNYGPNYWKLRDDGRIASRASDPMTKREMDGRIREYQYSTVMDYGNNFVVGDAHGIGHYDVAAIKMGYGDLSEVFTSAPAENRQAIAELDAQAGPFMVFQLDPSANGRFVAWHYSSWPNMLGGVANIEKRTDVRYKDLKFVASPLFGGGGFSMYSENGKTYPAVPYLFCNDYFADSRPTCNRYDAGADAYETMQSVIDNYWNYYPFSHFQRQRLGWDPSAVPARSMARYFDKLASATHIYALYRQFLEPFLGARFFEQEDGFGLYTLGVRATYDLFRQVIATPEPGDNLGKEELVDGTRIVSSEPPSDRFSGAEFGVDSFDGRWLRSQFDIGSGVEWWQFTSSGWFKEKQLALESLLWADTGYLGTDTSPDVREYSSSFYTIFPDSMSEFMRAMYAGDVKAYGPRKQGEEIVYPTPNEILKRGSDMPGDIISPNVGFSLQLAAMAFGMNLIPNTFDQDFVNRSRVFVAGSSEAVELDPAAMVSFKDERSGMTYYAGSYMREDVKGMEGTSLETGPGAAMINVANALKARVEQAVTKGDAGAAQKWQAKLYDFTDNLDILRYLGSQVGHGSDGEF